MNISCCILLTSLLEKKMCGVQVDTNNNYYPYPLPLGQYLLKNKIPHTQATGVDSVLGVAPGKGRVWSQQELNHA